MTRAVDGRLRLLVALEQVAAAESEDERRGRDGAAGK
jgi:hypothetical protein